MIRAYASKRPAADIIETLLKKLSDNDLPGIVDAVQKYRGGAIYPFESDAFDIVRDLEYATRSNPNAPPLTLDHIRTMWASIENDPQYTWAFQPGQRVVCVTDHGNLKRGETYAVLGCILGESWGGQEEYVHLDLPENADLDKPVGYGTGMFVDRLVWRAINAARDSDGVLYVAHYDKSGEPLAYSAQNVEISADLVRTLVDQGALRLEPTLGNRAHLMEGSWLVKKCGLKLSAGERLRMVLSRHTASCDIEPTSTEAEAMAREMGLKD